MLEELIIQRKLKVNSLLIFEHASDFRVVVFVEGEVFVHDFVLWEFGVVGEGRVGCFDALTELVVSDLEKMVRQIGLQLFQNFRRNLRTS